MLPSALVAVLVAGVLGVAAVPAAAAACPDGRGVTVIVDPGALGGDVTEECVEGGGGLSAAQIVQRAGHELAYVQGQPFVCRLDGRPGMGRESCARIPPVDAYWGLYWAGDRDDGWTYSTLGVAALTVPEGGAVGWRWQDRTTRAEPQVPTVTEQKAPVAAASSIARGVATSGPEDEVADGGGPALTWLAGLLALALAVGVVVAARRRRA